MLNIPYRKQHTDWTCGPAALSGALAYFGIKKSEAVLAREMKTTKTRGTSRKSMVRAARKAGLSVQATKKSSFSKIGRCLHAKKVVVVNFVEPKDKEGHYAPVTGITNTHVVLNDPIHGKGFRMRKKEFRRLWNKRNRWMMVISRN